MGHRTGAERAAHHARICTFLGTVVGMLCIGTVLGVYFGVHASY